MSLSAVPAAAETVEMLELGPSPFEDPEACFIGALLHSGRRRDPELASITEILDRVHTADLSDPRARLTLDLIRIVHQDGDLPDPVAIMAVAERTGKHGTPGGLRNLGNYTRDVYLAVPHPGNIDAYADAVIAAAWRRNLSTYAADLGQHAENSSAADVFHVLRTGHEALREHYGRCRRQPGENG